MHTFVLLSTDLVEHCIKVQKEKDEKSILGVSATTFFSLSLALSLTLAVF